jgi:LCP family protein required for cell wall assembly
MSGYRRRQDKKRLYKGLGIAAGVLILGIAVIGVVLGMADHYRINSDSSTDSREMITYKNETYVKKGNLETYLIAGIDAPGKVEKVTEYDGTGQCDVLAVIVRDRSTDQCKLLSIDRNTITAVKSLDNDGTYLDTTDIQISLAHAMGFDQQVRAENTVDAVSHLLGDQTIDGYAMVNMGAIQVVNDMVGGVTVTIEDDFSDIDPSMKKGETVTLMGEQAEKYVRSRKEVADGSNQNRMSRQSTYEEAFKPAFRNKCAENSKFPLEVYHAMEDYMTTNISAKKFCRLAILMSDENQDEKVAISGTYGLDEDEWQTFTPDEDSLQEAILELFYQKQ